MTVVQRNLVQFRINRHWTSRQRPQCFLGVDTIFMICLFKEIVVKLALNMVSSSGKLAKLTEDWADEIGLPESPPEAIEFPRHICC